MFYKCQILTVFFCPTENCIWPFWVNTSKPYGQLFVWHRIHHVWTFEMMMHRLRYIWPYSHDNRILFVDYWWLVLRWVSVFFFLYFCNTTLELVEWTKTQFPNTQWHNQKTCANSFTHAAYVRNNVQMCVCVCANEQIEKKNYYRKNPQTRNYPAARLEFQLCRRRRRKYCEYIYVCIYEICTKRVIIIAARWRFYMFVFIEWILFGFWV